MAEKAVGLTALGAFKTQIEGVITQKVADAELEGAEVEFATEADVLALFAPPQEPEPEQGE